MYRSSQFFLVIILTIVLLGLGACKAGPAETITMTVTQPAKTVTQSASTITQPAATITKTVTTTIGQTQTSTSTTSTIISTTSTKTTTTRTTIIPPGATTMNAEPQIVTSADGKAQITALQVLAQGRGACYSFLGKITSTDSSNINAEIKVRIFNRYGELLETVSKEYENIDTAGVLFSVETTYDAVLVEYYIIEINILS